MRHRQQQFKSPLELHEFDPERLLWVPGKKKIFIPAPPAPVPAWESIDWTRLTPTPFEINNKFDRSYYMLMAECTPGRSEHIVPVPRRDNDRFAGGTWDEVQRSDEPMFRTRRLIR